MTSQPGDGGPEDEGLWEGYLNRVIDEDTRLIVNWRKTLDTLLVYVGLFLGVLTAFLIQVSSSLQPDPGEMTNRILIAIYNQTMNGSLAIDLEQYIRSKAAPNPNLFSNIFLLCICVVVSVVVAAFALIISIWLTRYQHSITEKGPTIHDRIRKRQDAYRSLVEWRLPALIEILPIVVLALLLVFGAFIRQSIQGIYPIIGYIVYIIFTMAALFFLLTSSFAAFIPDSPFHSPLSDFIRFIFRIFPNGSIRQLIRIRTVCVGLLCIAAFVVVCTSVLTQDLNNLFLYLLSVSLVSLTRRSPQSETQTQEQSKIRLLSLATWVYSCSIVIIALFIVSMFVTHGAIHIILFALTGTTICVVTYVTAQISQWTPNASLAKVEAVAWMIKTQPSHDMIVFQKALEIAQSSPHLRPTLLKDILPVLDVLIRSIKGQREEDIKQEEKLYITLLAVLVDFEPRKAAFWRNEAALEQPVISDGLKKKLRILSRGAGCGHSLPPLSGCTKADAGFVLLRVLGEKSVEMEIESA